ncbi:replication factor C small subunit [Halorubellus litoreus]|uniref:Replication factor C small subunit n=1 Tax=Halorubellus litoreus TaxID=755308 RepID=A0ABD5VGD2_9EURY
MSESADEGDRPAGKTEVWIEKYRPESLADVVGHEDIISRIESYVRKNDLPHLMFAGPAGVGKCATGETPVLTNEGVQRIEDVVGDVDGFASPRADLEVATFTEGGEFAFVEPSEVFSKSTDALAAVETRDGGQLRVTPEHRLLVVDEDGLTWREAEKLEAGDRVARPLETPTPDADDELEWLAAINGKRYVATVAESFAAEHEIPAEEQFVGAKKRIVRGLREDDVDGVDASGSVTVETIEAYANRLSDVDVDSYSTVASVEFLRSLDVDAATLESNVESLQYVPRNGQETQPITPPWTASAELAEFVAWVVSEARVDSGRIRFYNTDESIIERFESLAEDLFGVETERMERKGVPFVRIRSRTLTGFLEACFDVVSSDGIGSTLVTAPSDAREAFLRAMFDAEAHVSKNGIVEFTQKDGDVVSLVSYLLGSLGIPSRRKTEQKAATNGSGIERTYHTLYVSGASALSRFEERIGFSIDEKTERLAMATARDSNPNHDTIPTQRAVDDLCDVLALNKTEHVPTTTNPDSPGRERYLESVESVLSAAVSKVETAQRVKEGVPADLDAVVATPAAWVGERERLEPLETRKDVAAETGVRSDRLLEYADGRRSPTAERAQQLLVELDGSARGDVAAVQQTLSSFIDDLGVSYNRVAESTGLRGTDVKNLLENDDHDLESLPRFATVADRIRAVADEMLSGDVLESLSMLDSLASESLYFDEVVSVTVEDADERVYDVTVPQSHNYVAGAVPTVMHNTATSVSIAKEVYGDDWRENFLELNASDQRGIDVVRDRIKNFARSSFGGYEYRIIFLDEADALTSDAQSALRRTMEQFSNNTRFILSCNYSSQIIDPIQSRCAVFRFSPLGDEAVATQVRKIADEEGLEVTDDGVDALVYAADGDMRRAINALQAASVTDEVVDEATVYAITSTARPEEVEEMVRLAIDGDFVASRSRLDELLTERGLAGGDIIDQLHRSAWEFDLDDTATVRLMDRLGEADFRITEGANERIQLEALLASLAR